ncbi:glutaredoxin domain-containing protein [Zhihengliuella sp.]|uniref:glutaredoxin domain-containing protein n=1 Tax=Zhihengliuella sp. TaxID=1954483 RepID=UPI0028118558|nr:glutaredoxin domain-containing protein [Zhihengliuella sp.]
MRRLTAHPALLPGFTLLLAAAVLIAGLIDGLEPLDAVIVLALLAFTVFAGIALTVRSGPASGAEQRVAAGGVAVYWRPGCVYCLKLMWALRSRLGDAYWVNIWEDDDGAAAVRAVNGGNETVPTLVGPDGAFVATDRAAAVAEVDRRRRH